MSKILKPQYNSIINIITIFAIFSMLSIGVFLFKTPVTVYIYFFLFIIFYVQIPGLFIIKKLNTNFCHISTNLSIGLFVGWSLEIVIFFISDIIKNNILLLILGPIFSLLYLFNIIRNKKSTILKPNSILNSISPALSIFAAFVLLYALINTQYTYIQPSYCDYTYMNPDKAYHIGLINSLSHDYPLYSQFIDGIQVNYHFFSELLYSIPVRIFNISSDNIFLCCAPYFTTYCITISSYSFFKELTQKKNRAGLYTLCILLSNIYIARSKIRSMGFHFFFTNDNSAGYGISVIMATIILIKYWMNEKNKKTSIRFFLLLFVFIMLATGIKGPMGAVLIAALWGAFLLGLILRKLNFQFAVPLTIITIGFILIYTTILGSKGQANGNGDSIISLATIINVSFWKKSLIATMKGLHLPLIIRYCILFITFLAFFFTVFFAPFCIGYIRELILVLSERKDFDFTRVTVYAATFVGLLAMFLLNYSGHSQIYFGLVSLYFAPIISFWFLEDIEGKNPILFKSVVAVFCASLVCTSSLLGTYYIHNIKGVISSYSLHNKYDMYLSISNDEYDAMRWIANNTDSDSVIAIDRYYSVDPNKYSFSNRWDNRFFLYPAYANRQCYIAGSGYNLAAADWRIRKTMIENNKKLYQTSNNSRGTIAKKLGIDYVVVSKRFTKVNDLSNNMYKLYFENNDILIYKVQ